MSAKSELSVISGKITFAPAFFIARASAVKLVAPYVTDVFRYGPVNPAALASVIALTAAWLDNGEMPYPMAPTLACGPPARRKTFPCAVFGTDSCAPVSDGNMLGFCDWNHSGPSELLPVTGMPFCS